MAIEMQSMAVETDELSTEETLAQGAAKPLLELCRVLEDRYSDLTQHGRSVAAYCAMTARALGMTPGEVERVALAGELHDLGKVSVDEDVLLKPTRLTPAEWAQIERHPQVGADLLYEANLDDVAHWVLAHHERPDGEGYPHGLAADEIPIQSKILAVADSYDAMRADRVYKEAMTHEEAAEELLRGAGRQFDETVVEAFLRAIAEPGPQAGTAVRA